MDEPRAMAAAHPGARLLVVDDEPANLRLLERILARAGYGHVETAGDGAEVPARVRSGRPDLILLDLHMPGVDGFAVLAALAAALPPEEYLPVLVLTADASPAIRNRALQAGARDFVVKPFDAEEVLLRIRNLLDVRFLQQQLDAQNRRLEEQLRHAQRLEVVGRLTGGIAHDFSNLLTVVRGNTELMLMDQPPASDIRGELEENLKVLNSAQALTRRLLAFSRPETLQRGTLDLNETVADLSRTLLHLIGARVRVETRLAPGRLPVVADPGQLQQVLMNLAVNARDAMPAGGRIEIATRRVEVAGGLAPGSFAVAAGRYAVLRFSDTGHGMSAETRGRIFEPFFTTKENAGGTGLGLSIVYGIVKQSGGYVWAESEPGEGTVFHVYLPEAAAPPAAPGAPAGNGAATGPVVLVVQEDARVRTLLNRLLRRAGYSVAESRDGEDAVRRVEEGGPAPDVLLCDLSLPDQGALGLARRLLELRSDTAVVLTSPSPDPLPRGDPLRVRSVVVAKPFSPAAVRNAIRAALAQRPAPAGESP